MTVFDWKGQGNLYFFYNLDLFGNFAWISMMQRIVAGNNYIYLKWEPIHSAYVFQCNGVLHYIS